MYLKRISYLRRTTIFFMLQVEMELFRLYIDDDKMTNSTPDITKRFGHIIRQYEEQGTLANLTIEVERHKKDGKLEFYDKAIVTWLPESTRLIQPRFPEVIYGAFESISEYFFELLLKRPISENELLTYRQFVSE